MANDPFDEWYPQFRSLYEDAVGTGVSPMAIFGIMIGIVAQEFKAHSTRDEFIHFLAELSSVSWPKDTSPNGNKKKPKLKIVH